MTKVLTRDQRIVLEAIRIMSVGGEGASLTEVGPVAQALAIASALTAEQRRRFAHVLVRYDLDTGRYDLGTDEEKP